tara:strand:- start:41 stop:505 length:465 start_codon:yes stop_codon:yes gene_type:complete
MNLQSFYSIALNGHQSAINDVKNGSLPKWGTFNCIQSISSDTESVRINSKLGNAKIKTLIDIKTKRSLIHFYLFDNLIFKIYLNANESISDKTVLKVLRIGNNAWFSSTTKKHIKYISNALDARFFMFTKKFETFLSDANGITELINYNDYEVA